MKSPPQRLLGIEPDPVPRLSSEEPPLDLTGKVYQLEVMLKQLHTDLQKVRPPGSRLTWHSLPITVENFPPETPVPAPNPTPSVLKEAAQL